MTVWVVTEEYRQDHVGEYTSVKGVFATEELARQYCETRPRQRNTSYKYDSWTVRQPEPPEEW